MKRPLAVVGLSFLAAQTAAALCGFAVTAALLGVTVLCALILFLFVKARPAWLLPVVISCAVCFACYTVGQAIKVRPAQSLQGQEVFITGRVCEEPYESFGRWYYIVETDSVSMRAAEQEVRLRLSGPSALDAEYNDSIRSLVRFGYSEEDSATTRRLLADGVVLTASLPRTASPVVTKGGTSLYGMILDIKRVLTQSARRLMGDETAGLLIGMLTGDTSGISERVLSDFRACGLSHLFAVSGLHLSILVFALQALLKRMRLGYRAVAALTIPFVVFFMAFAGFSMSVRRAGIMLLLSLTARAIKREADPLNSLGFAALAVCLFSPFAAGDAGMLMSFSSTLGLIVLSDPINRRVRDALRIKKSSRMRFLLDPLLKAVVTSCVASVCTFPVVVLSNGEVSVIAPFVNALCIYPASLLLVSGTLAAALYAIPVVGAVPGFIAFLPTWLSGRLVLILTGAFARLPGAGVAARYPFIPLFLAAAAGLVVLWLVFFRKEEGRARVLALCAALVMQVFICGVGVYNVLGSRERSIMVFDADGGIMTAVISGGRCMLIGSGGDSYSAWLAAGELAERNINRAEVILLPDNSERCAGSAVEMISQMEPNTAMLLPSGARFELLEAVCRENETMMYDAREASYRAEGCGLSFEVITDEQGGTWIWAESGCLSMLCAPEKGDALALPGRYRAPDILLLTDEGIANVTRLEPLAVIVLAEDGEAARMSAVLGYRGVENIFIVAQDGYLTVTPSGEGIAVSDH